MGATYAGRRLCLVISSTTPLRYEKMQSFARHTLSYFRILIKGAIVRIDLHRLINTTPSALSASNVVLLPKARRGSKSFLMNPVVVAIIPTEKCE